MDGAVARHPLLARPWPLVVYGGSAALVGVAIAYLMAGAADVRPERLVSGAIIGLCAFAIAIGGEIALFRPISRLRGAWQFVARAAMFTFAGFAGVYAGLLVSSLIFGGFAIPRFHAAIPITVAIGACIGMIAFTIEHLRGRLADSIASLKEKEFAEKELELARDIQKRLLPARDLDGEGWRVAARNEAARWVAGDFYDVFPLADGSVGLVVADVAGKGIGASLIMASVKAVLPLLAAGKGVAATMNALNDKLAAELGKREFVALAFARLDAATGALHFVNAGLPDAWLLRAGAAPAEIAAPEPRLPLGLRRGLRYAEAEVRLERGDAVLFLSDGIPESGSGDDDLLGYDGLAALLASRAGDAPGEWIDALFTRARERAGRPPDDDWTVLVVQRV